MHGCIDYDSEANLVLKSAMMRFIFVFSALICVVLSLTSCRDVVPYKATLLGAPEFTGQPYHLMVATVALKDTRKPQPTDVQLSHNFPTTLKDGLRSWLQNRVKASGKYGMLVAELKQAIVTEELIDDNFTWWGMVPTSEKLEYTATLQVALKIIDEYDRQLADVETTVYRKITLPRDLAVPEQQEAFNKLVLSTLKQMDENFDRQIPYYFQPYIISMH